VGVVVGLYLAALLALNIPYTQRKIADAIESVLTSILGTQVDVGRVEVQWNGRIVAYDLQVEDQKGAEMLNVTRVAARIGISDLLRHRIRIGNAQLFGAHVNLYQEHPDSATNFQFVFDAFSSKKDSTHTPLDLRISQLLVRRTNVNWDKRWEPHKPGFDPAHIALKNLNITAHLNTLTDDSLNLRIKRLDAKERSGLCVKSLSFDLLSGKQGTRLTDFTLALPSSSLTGSLEASREIRELGQLNDVQGKGSITGHIVTNDFTPFAQKLDKIKEEADIVLDAIWADGRLNVERLDVTEAQGKMSLKASGEVRNLTEGLNELSADAYIHHLDVEASALTPYVKSTIPQRIGNAHLTGHLTWEEKMLQGRIETTSGIGILALEGNGKTDGSLDVNITSDQLELDKLLPDPTKVPIGNIAMDLDVKGKVSKRPELSVIGTIKDLELKGYRYRNIALDGQIKGKRYEGKVDIDDANLTLHAEGFADLENPTVKLDADVERISPHMLNLTKKFDNTLFACKIEADLQGESLKNPEGRIFLDDFLMLDSTGSYHPGDIHITSTPDGNERNIYLVSPFLEAQVKGAFDPTTLAAQVRSILNNYVPMIKAGDKRLLEGRNDNGSFIMKLYTAEPFRKLLGLPLELHGTLMADGRINTEDSTLFLNLTAPEVKYNTEHFRNISLRLENNAQSLNTSLELQRLMKERWILFGLESTGADHRLVNKLYWNNNTSPSYAGDLNVISRIWQDENGKQGFEGNILSSNFNVGDTLWSIHPGRVAYYDETLLVDSLCISRGNRMIRVEGKASKNEEDLLHARLEKINLEYIFSLINFHAVDFAGEATGDVYARTLFSHPYADADIKIPNFSLNGRSCSIYRALAEELPLPEDDGINRGILGDLAIRINWGERPYSIALDGEITDTPHNGHTHVKGYVTPKKDIEYHGLDLNIEAKRVNAHFINKWTAKIFDDMEARATGKVHLYGPFKKLNINGDINVEEGSVGVPFIGVNYHLTNDSIHLRPNLIYFDNARLYDPQGNPGTNGHYGVVNGKLTHDHFSNLTYDINIEGNNILGYNFKEFGDMNFYGTVYANGNVRINGAPGYVNIDIKATPLRGTTFTYNVSSPDKLTETPFISYVNRNDTIFTAHEEKQNKKEEEISNDMRITFDLDIDNQATMNLLMDAQSGDKISINGSGHMRASYYDKGAFLLFGTYRVERGTYNLSLQEVIRKNFEFTEGGTITFNGEPFAGDLNLQAVHTVSGVSLNDLNAKANFSNTSARVNCLMNITGKAREPQVSFDFDIQNVNEEEKQMVRSLISTEEERNMQVIYLLGIGRFYAYDYANENQTQGSTAMNSLLSSTLSSTINTALTNIIGSSNWNFGTNLKTGETGWSDMDVEGMLQGSLLNNRLLINGNFGYRDTPVANSNFIGDFDVKYLLTRSGSVALKAYSETNDRYFTKSSLTTQGIGILLKKDFTSWRDLMRIRKKKK